MTRFGCNLIVFVAALLAFPTWLGRNDFSFPAFIERARSEIPAMRWDSNVTICVYKRGDVSFLLGELRKFIAIASEVTDLALPLVEAVNNRGCSTDASIRVFAYQDNAIFLKTFRLDLQGFLHAFNLNVMLPIYHKLNSAYGSVVVVDHGKGHAALVVLSQLSANMDDIETHFARSHMVEEMVQVLTNMPDLKTARRPRSMAEEYDLAFLDLPKGYETGAAQQYLAKRPRGACRFDLLMMYVLFRSGLPQTATASDYIAWYEQHESEAEELVSETMSRHGHSGLIDQTC